MANSKFNFSYETQEDNRLYILWDNQFDNEGTQLFPENEEIQEFIETLDNELFLSFDEMEMDKGVASHFGYDNCQIFGIDEQADK